MPKSRKRVKTKQQQRKSAERKKDQWNAAHRRNFPDRYTLPPELREFAEQQELKRRYA